MKENSVAAFSSSTTIAESITLISSRDVWIKVREVRVSSVFELSLHCTSSFAILVIVRYMIFFTLRSISVFGLYVQCVKMSQEFV